MAFLSLPTELIAMVGDKIHHDYRNGEISDGWNYKYVVRYWLSSKVIKAAVEAETTRRYTAAITESHLTGKELAFALRQPFKHSMQKLLPAGRTLHNYPHSLSLAYMRAVYKDHSARTGTRGGDADTTYNLGWGITHGLAQMRRHTTPLAKLPASAEILVIRVHPSDQPHVNVRASVCPTTLVTGMKCDGETYLVLPGTYVLTDELKGYIHALFGRYFITTIAELKDALEKDDADGGVKAQAEYDAALPIGHESALEVVADLK
jgi:hypothetical protein